MNSSASSGEVFISYSHDSEEHVRNVLALLRSEGIDCVLDQYESSPPEGWPRWMDRKINEAQFVLMVCTPTYLARIMGSEKENTGLGVRWEGNLIYQHIYNAGSNNTKFIPVLLRSEDGAHIPTPVQGVSRYCIATEEGYAALYGRLIAKPKAQKPPLGKLHALEAKKVQTDFSLYLSMPIDIPLAIPADDVLDLGLH